MKRLYFALILASYLWMNFVPVALAENTTLIPCKDSPAFIERMQNAPESYYTTKPFQAYSRLLCGEDGLPHLVLDRLNLAFDVVVPIAMFLFIADLALFVSCMVKALMWPMLAIKEFLSGELVAKDDEIPISIR